MGLLYLRRVARKREMMELERHFNHDIVIARYSGLDDEPVNYAVECETCYEVIIDQDVSGIE